MSNLQKPSEITIDMEDDYPTNTVDINVVKSSLSQSDNTNKEEECLGDGVRRIHSDGSKHQEGEQGSTKEGGTNLSVITDDMASTKVKTPVSRMLVGSGGSSVSIKGGKTNTSAITDDDTTPRKMKTPRSKAPLSARGSSVTANDKIAGAITAQYLREKKNRTPPQMRRTVTVPQVERKGNSLYSPTINKRSESTRNSFDMCIGMNGHDDDIVVAKIDGVEITQSDVEKLIEETMNSTIENLNLLAGYNYQKSFWFKGIDNTLYIFLQLLLIATSIIGVYQAANNTSGDSNSDIFIVVGVMGLVAGFTVEFGRRYKFDRRSITLYTCAQDFEAVISELRELHFDPLDPREKLHRIHLYQRHIDTIEKRAFDSQFTMSRGTGGNKYETAYIKPGDIPIEEE
jgi:hypothetical protein